jgi:hypothetical protein
LAKAVGKDRDQLCPRAVATTPMPDRPAFEMRQVSGTVDRVWLTINQEMSFATAAQIVDLIRAEQAPASASPRASTLASRRPEHRSPAGAGDGTSSLSS